MYVPELCGGSHVWQSQVENEHYSVGGASYRYN